MRLFFSLCNFINNFIYLKIYEYIYIKIFTKLIPIFIMFFVDNLNKFVDGRVYYNKDFYYNILFRRQIYLKPLKFNLNLSKINFNKFWINYIEREKTEFFYVENYGNVSSIKYDLRTYPFWILKIFKIDFNYLKSKIPEIKILPFLKKLEYLIRSININLTISISNPLFNIEEFFFFENLKKIPFNLICFKFKQIYIKNSLLFKINLNLLFLIFYYYYTKINNKFKFILSTYICRYLKFKFILSTYICRYLKFCLLLVNKFNLKYYFFYFKLNLLKKKIFKFLNFRMLNYFFIIFLWFLKNSLKKINYIFLYFIKLIRFIIISLMEPYIKINFWKNRFFQKFILYKNWLINFLYFIKIFRTTIQKNLRWK